MRLVVKVGTNVLTDNSDQVQGFKVEEIVSQIFNLKKDHQIILVSSGAMALGKQALPELELSQKKQVWAAIGQPLLMNLHAEQAEKFSLEIGQCLLLRDDFTDRDSYDHFVNTIEGMLTAKILPIINENDVVAMSDLTVGDNDLLAAMVAVALDADKLILLTNQSGLYTANPDTDADAKLISEVKNIDAELEKLYSDKTVSSLGRGGVLSKIRAARHAVNAGIETYIVDGRKKDVLGDVLSKKDSGTRFLTTAAKASSLQKRWLMSAKGFGQLVVDDGAVKALEQGKSLLLPGIIAIKGLFDKTEIVEIISKTGLAVAYGKVNYSSQDIQKAVKLKNQTDKKSGILEKEVIHRNYMVSLKF
ncbi:MAG: glutamate 5-kinase [bacterium]|nr:glutamate 5-kinase [bacterium]